MDIVEFIKSKEIKDMIDRSRRNALMQCVMHGHDYRDVDGIEGGKICICCGNRLDQKSSN